MTKQELMKLINTNSQNAAVVARERNYRTAYKILSNGINITDAFEIARDQPNSAKILSVEKFAYFACLDAILKFEYECAYYALDSVLLKIYDVLAGNSDPL